MDKTKIAGAIILNSKKQILLVQNWDKTWTFPKGHIEEKETALKAIKREILEETGVKELVLIKRLKSYNRYKLKPDFSEDKTELRKNQMFLFKTKTQKLKPLEFGLTAVWVTQKKAFAMLTSPKDQEFLETTVLPTISSEKST